MNEKLEEVSSLLLEQGKIVAVIGGDHSSPLGLIKSLAKQHDFGILQVDAHMDLRNAYEGFQYSHASIMYNVLKMKQVTKLVQVGIRDFCEEEEDLVRNAADRISVYYDDTIYQAKENGIAWSDQCTQIISKLPDKVYISFDVDGLDASLCPNTGTPVPGGLQFNEAVLLIEKVARAGKKIIGFDVTETGNHPWDANVASRILYRLAAYTGVSQQLLQFRK